MKHALDLLDAAVGIVVAALFVAALLLSLAGVAGRYVPNVLAPDWIGEVVIYIVIWAMLLGAARVLRRSGHIRVDFLLDRFPPTVRLAAELLSLVIAFGLSVFLIWSGWQVVTEAMMWDERSISTLRTPLWMYYVALPVSFGLQLVFLLERAVDLVAGRSPVTASDLTD
ncbi:TRAP transporter small permease [Pararhodobacter zhoushanensis]|uniref:TRAP transporter small permease protein n=1 Tax=Pararhodobacter zhoushanensis TaxID=2479545 RepID=A0ABT3GXT5_9RHOB|nr:TRAP transporter small permease [Pararhodobacter zhoushanensis]MCW1932280.1 TRAP transporter small permease [Pararhodobacter zhoushanensis]